ncbi:hypothetical protein AVEN_199954-1 [Araneus ventricosus]|uniref:Uncharacterized protein n=1 Tax=Araneus ventricosus TaxID=182803 RepID=A0A4Y2BWM1_ARAVE|nr:hypothetical protein AVEN_199954-1 [Araneus ventricosus]
MRRASAKFGPKLLSSDPKEDRLSAALDLFESAENEVNFLKMMVIEDEWWIYLNSLRTLSVQEDQAKLSIQLSLAFQMRRQHSASYIC